MAKIVKLDLAPARELNSAVIHAEIFDAATPEAGVTLVCGGCDGVMVEGLEVDAMLFTQVDLVCQHCGAVNDLDSSRL